MPYVTCIDTPVGAQGVIQAAQTQWYFNGGDLATTISKCLEVLERGIGTDPTTWSIE